MLQFHMSIFHNFKWDFESEVDIGERSLKIKAHPNSDCFVDPADGKKIFNAAFFHMETEKDFTIRAKVSHSFKSEYDACVLMVMSNENCWVKLCFELTDIGTHAVVSVVTNGVSDDANGVDIDGKQVYLQLAKKGHLFALHYSLDGSNYNMVRYFSLPIRETCKVGFVAQSPRGEGGDFLFEDIEINYTTAKDFRKGI